ncbi:hypothetical protein V7068_17035 [Bacillus sp. JJ634]
MNNLLSHLAQKAQTKINQAVEYVKDKVTTIMAMNVVTVQQMADYIANHVETAQETKELLGLKFSFYRLEKEGVHYYVEMKGSHILQLDIHIAGNSSVSYRSYRDSSILQSPLELPEAFYLKHHIRHLLKPEKI